MSAGLALVRMEEGVTTRWPAISVCVHQATRDPTANIPVSISSTFIMWIDQHMLVL